MILAEDEIGLGADHAGIMLLPDGHRAGDAARRRPAGRRAGARRDADDEPRRPALDGRARARGRGALDGELHRRSTSTTRRSCTPSGSRSTVEDLDGCPRYIARVFTNVTVGAVADVAARAPPRRRHALDLERRRRHELRDARLRQPAACLRPREARRRPHRRPARARRARSCATLDGTLRSARRARPADHRRREAGRARGDHGRARDARSPTTTTEVLLEAANFEPIGVLADLGAARRFAPRARTAGRRASTRTSPSRPPILASRLLVDLAGAELTGAARRPRRAARAGPSSRFRPERTDRIVGLEVARDEQRAILERLGFEVADAWDVTVPTWRARDVTREIDLVEEVARVVLDRVPHTMPLRRAVAGHLTDGAAAPPPRRGRARRRRVHRGVHLEPRRRRIPTRTRSGCPTR